MRAFLFLLLLGCARHESKDPSPKTLPERLGEKYQGWLAEVAASSDQGWPSARDCDGLLWAGIAKAGGATVPLELAEYNPGELHRRPMSSGECYPLESDSTISNDMLLGWLWGVWAARDVPFLERVAHFGESRQFVMGEPFPKEPRVVLSPSGQGLLGRMLEKLGSTPRPYSVLPEACLPVEADYEHHLQVLGILLNGEVRGSIGSLCLGLLQANAAAFPTDGLFAAALGVYSGDESPALALLLDDGYACPSYVRPEPVYCAVHKAFAASVILHLYKDHHADAQ